ncbi:MAG: hypothetical protein QG558_139, partial [Campylobacterota bacterium]|nr:hypothetical protein [Campylobacterota bacterium]
RVRIVFRIMEEVIVVVVIAIA